ncbi:MAG: phosphoglycerate mutase [Actinomycetota bacterium]|nr:phosphoglycerate mutase [Actinomycetota bacterium]
MAETGRGPLPILLVVLDGMPDRPYRSLRGCTPLETARTPVMDSLAREGQSGFYYPLGPGRIPSTELAHFRIFGYEGYPFPGRACLEALGHGVPCVPGDAFSFLAPRRIERGQDGAFYVVGGYGERSERAPAVYSALDGWTDVASGYRFEVFPLDGGEAILRIRQGDAGEPPRGEVTDSDPFFFTDLPVLRPRPLASAGQPETAALTADALNRFLLEAASMFDGGPSSTGPETLLVSKWTGTFAPLPPFAGLAGTAGASVASSGLFRGLARLIGLGFFHEPDGDLSGKLDRALGVLEAGEVEFVHVHTKVADEAAHSGDPAQKVEVIEWLDREMAVLRELSPDRLVLCATSDHCTPVGGRTVHWGDSVPLLVRGPYVRADDVTIFDERSATRGSLGQIGTGDLLPYLLCQADRAHFKGARPTPEEVLGIPHNGEAWPGR